MTSIVIVRHVLLMQTVSTLFVNAKRVTMDMAILVVNVGIFYFIILKIKSSVILPIQLNFPEYWKYILALNQLTSISMI